MKHDTIIQIKQMKFSHIFLIVCLFLLTQLSTLMEAQQVFACHYCMGNRGNYTSTSTYSKNLKNLLSSITSTTTQIDDGSFKSSVGQNSNRIYGVAMCRGDLSTSDCHNCLDEAAMRLPAVCPTQKEAIGYYFSECMLRYSDRPIFGIKELTPNCTRQYSYEVPDAAKFTLQLSILFDQLSKNASAGGSHYKFAIGSVNVTASLQVYGLMQCDPDLSHSDCFECLQEGISELESCCNTISGAGVYGPSCGVEFSNFRFSDMNSTSSPSSSSSGYNKSNQGKRWNARKIWIVNVLVFVLLVLLVTLVLRFLWGRKRNIHEQVVDQNKVKLTCVDSLQFDFRTIQVATNYFSNAKRLGKGDSPTTVYKGILSNEQEIAIKSVSENGRYGELEFNNEISLLADLQHRNLVKLLGFCVEKDSRYLIYEYLPNESLDLFLYDHVKRAHLDWGTRHKIILGISRGLLYLHEDSQLQVIHRDLKPSNILLDVVMNPKISDFSKASLVQADQTRGTRSTILGTYGYMPPEYVEQGQFSVKSDVFSFGVILLEIISGQQINSFFQGEKSENLPNFVWRKWFEGKALEVVDQTQQPSIQNHATQISRCINIALLCVQVDPSSRPSISSVVVMLNSNLVTIAEPSRPASIILSDMVMSSLSYSSGIKDTSSKKSVNEVSMHHRI